MTREHDEKHDALNTTTEHRASDPEADPPCLASDLRALLPLLLTINIVLLVWHWMYRLDVPSRWP